MSNISNVQIITQIARWLEYKHLITPDTRVNATELFDRAMMSVNTDQRLIRTHHRQ